MLDAFLELLRRETVGFEEALIEVVFAGEFKAGARWLEPSEALLMEEFQSTVVRIADDESAISFDQLGLELPQHL